MKKSLLILGAALALVSCNKEGAATASGFKTAYVDTSKLVEESQELKDLEDKAKVKEEELGRELQNDARQLQLDAASFQKEAAVKGEQWAQLRGQDLQKRNQELTVKQQTIQQEFAKEFGVKRDTIVSQMKRVIKEYGKKNGYDYVYGTGDAASILYAKDSYDITKEILSQVNSKYKGAAKEDTTTAKAEEAKEEKK
ncbi:OmpH family outer membrane protein [Flavobacterium psychrotrophum]|uniref:OmpH family outer membrane protein n=1 Tax=Flavobacterium psychrotrophum TaxID=2294119 RepID=UPI000E31CB07|nr:OmpH family outer membrane protein [Flavobacterium psychrotrophum]